MSTSAATLKLRSLAIVSLDSSVLGLSDPRISPVDLAQTWRRTKASLSSVERHVFVSNLLSPPEFGVFGTFWGGP